MASRHEQASGHRPAAEASAPPRAPFVLSVAVTGHRSDALPDESLPAIEHRLRSVLKLLSSTASKLHAAERESFAPDPARFMFLSPLAEGADQIAARAALDLGFELHAILPFARADYDSEFSADGRRKLLALLERADRVLELPGRRDRSLEAYVMTGRSTVAHSDVLVAVWDGLPPRGRGGTGEVAQLALVRGTPVIHVPLDPDAPVRIIWSAFDPAVVTDDVDEAAAVVLDPARAEQVLKALLVPPLDPQERQFLARFHVDRPPAIRTRVEYPLLLAGAGVTRFGSAHIRESRCAAAIREEWQRYASECQRRLDVDPALGLLEQAYAWSDRLASHFAQTYRSGHVFNFLFGGLAVCMGLSTFLFPAARLHVAMLEFVVTLGIILNTNFGVRHEWHRRWLDYRQLAERLRPMRSLKLLGIAAPDPPGTVANPVPRRWIEWYSRRVWQAIGCPTGVIAADRAADLAHCVAEYEIAPQVEYHKRSARQIDALDRRLELLGTILFVATLFVTVATAIGLWLIPDWVSRYDNWFTLVSAGFPALGTAVFGIRYQGDFGGSAVRSQTTADTLGNIHDELAKNVGLTRAANLTEQAARIMLADLDEWRLVNQQQDLGIG